MKGVDFMAKKTALQRTVAGVAALIMALGAVEIPIQTAIPVYALSDGFDSDQADTGSTAYWLQFLYEPANYPQFAIVEGISGTVYGRDTKTDTKTAILNFSSIPDVQGVLTGTDTYWLDSVSGVTKSEFQQSFVDLKAFLNERAGSRSSEPTSINEDFTGMSNEIFELDFNKVPKCADNATLFSVYNAYLKYMYDADMLFLNLNFEDMKANLASYKGNAVAGAGSTKITRDSAYATMLKAYLGSAQLKNATNIESIFTDSCGLYGYFDSLKNLQTYMTKYAGFTKDMTFEEYCEKINGVSANGIYTGGYDNIDGLLRRSQDSFYAFTAICRLLEYTYNVCGTDPYMNDADLAKLYKGYAVANTLGTKLSEDSLQFYLDMLQDDHYNISAKVACSCYTDFRYVIDAINCFDIGSFLNKFDDIKLTANKNTSAGSPYEATPFFNLGLTKFDSKFFGSDLKRGTVSTADEDYNIYSQIKRFANGRLIGAANSDSASYLQRLLYNAGIEQGKFSRAKDSSGAETIYVKTWYQDPNGALDYYSTSSEDPELGLLYSTISDKSFTSVNWGASIRDNAVKTRLSKYIDGYTQLAANAFMGYSMIQDDDDLAACAEIAAKTTLLEAYNLTGDGKFIIEINHVIDGVGDLPNDDEEPEDPSKFPEIPEDDPDNPAPYDPDPKKPSGLTGNNASFVPYIPEYSLSEYYNGIEDVATPSELAGSVSRLDGGSYGAITSYLSSLKNPVTKPATVELKVKVDPEWNQAMSSVTTNKTYNKGWKSGSKKFTTYDLGEYSGSHNIDINNNGTYRVVNDGSFDSPTLKTSGIISEDKLTSTENLYTVMAEAYGNMNGNSTPYFKAIQRLLYPIEQYTNDGTNPDADLNILTTVGGNARKSSDGTFYVYATNSSVPELTWNFTKEGSIVNQNQPDGKKPDKTFTLDYHMWVSRSSDKDGVYVADWVNSTPTLLNGLIGDTGAANGTVTNPGGGTSVYQPYDALGDYEADNYDITLNSASVDADFSDWKIGKKIKKSEYVWCDEHKVLIPKDKIEDHRYIWYEVKGEGKQWEAEEGEYEETFTYTWIAPSWQTDLQMLSRDSGTFTFDTTSFLTTIPPEDFKDESKFEDGDGNKVTVNLEPTDKTPGRYSSFNDTEREADTQAQRDRNRFFYDCYHTYYKGNYTSGEATSHNGKHYKWEYAYRFEDNKLWTGGGIQEIITCLQQSDPGSGAGNIAWNQVKSKYDSYDKGYLNFAFFGRKNMTNTSSSVNSSSINNGDGFLYYFLEAKVRIKVKIPKPSEVTEEDPPEKDYSCHHDTVTYTDYIYDENGYIIDINTHTALKGDCKYTDEEQKFTQDDLTYTPAEDEDSEDMTEESEESEGKDNVVKYWYAKVEEGETITYDGESPQSVKVCEDPLDEVLVYWHMDTNGTATSSNTDYEDPQITYDDNHEGSESNPLKDVIKATAVYSTGEGTTQEPSAMGTEHPESVIKEAAEKEKQRILDECKPKSCSESGCNNKIQGTCKTGKHSVVRCSCKHDMNFQEETHFYPDDAEHPQEQSYTSMDECLKGRDFLYWAITDMSGNELDEEGIKAECLKVTNPGEWVTFDNADKVSGLLLASKGNHVYKEMPTTYDGKNIMSNSNNGVFEADTGNDNNEKLAGQQYTGTVTNAKYSYNPTIIRKVITGSDGESNVWHKSTTFEIDYAATAAIKDKDIFGVTLKNGTWQSDHITSLYKYNIVPEVLMTYKTGVLSEGANIFPTGAWDDNANRGVFGNVYVAGYNKYTMDIPMYNKIIVDASGSTASVVGAAVASDSNAKTLSSKNGNAQVFYTGTEINTTTTLKSHTDGKATAEFTSYVLDFDDANSNVKKAWNTGSTSDDAFNAANKWLGSFLNENGKFEARATTYITFNDKSVYTDRSEAASKDEGMAEVLTGADYSVKEHKRLESIETVEFGGSNNKYANESEHYDIVIRNGRLFSITVGGTEYNLYGDNNGDGYATSEALIAAFKNGGASSTAAVLYSQHPDIAEALVNMKMAEFAATMDHNCGTEIWGQYQSIPAIWESTPASGGLWNSIKAIKESNQTASKLWYAEDSTVLTIRKYTMSVDLPDAVIASTKIPADYGYKTQTDKSKQFTSGAVSGFAEFSLEFLKPSERGVAPVKTDDEREKTMAVTYDTDSNANHSRYTYAAWDIIGDELTGAKVSKVSTEAGCENRKPQQQFIISDASVNDMY